MNAARTVFVLGAGFSKDAGCPLVSHFTRKSLFNEMRTKLQGESFDLTKFNQVSHFIRDRIKDGYCDNNIESVLNHVATAKYLGTRSLTEDKNGRYFAKDIFTDIQWFIVKVLEKKTKKRIPSHYYTFVKDICTDKHPIITLNYDLVLERVLQDLGQSFRYGIGKESNSGRVILKLHGSVNWFFCDTCGPIVAGSDSYVALDVYKGIAKCPNCGSKEVQPILIPPLLYKDSFYQDPKGGNWIKDLWMEAHRQLATARNVIFIGFAMSDNDAYVQELFKIASSANTTKGLDYLVVNPFRNKINYQKLKKRYKRVLVDEKIKFMQHSFRKYVETFQ